MENGDGKMITLVCGLSGSGKSTYAKDHIGDGLAYDMDAISSAFRLRMPHEEYHRNAREMANRFLFGFLYYVRTYAENVIVIRTAPRISEVQEIDPDKIVILKTLYVSRPMDDLEAVKKRLDDLERYAVEAGIELEVIKPQY